jgi:hypothetical protein
VLVNGVPIRVDEKQVDADIAPGQIAKVGSHR